VDRAGFWFHYPDRGEFHNLAMFDSVKEEFISAHIIDKKFSPSFYQQLITNQTVDIGQVDPRAEFIGLQGIRSFLAMQVHARGSLLGVLCLERHGSPQSWPDTQKAYAFAVCQLIAKAYQNYQLAKLEAEVKLVNKRQTFKVLEVPVPVLLVDPKSLRIIEANEHAQRLYGYSQPEFIALRMADLQMEQDVNDELWLPDRGEAHSTVSVFATQKRQDDTLFNAQVVTGWLSYKEDQVLVVVVFDVNKELKLFEENSALNHKL
jgi:GAF domain-containing protein